LGLLDRILGREPERRGTGVDLKQKYRAVLELAERERVRVVSLRVEGGRLYLTGAAPSEDSRGRILDAIRAITPEAGDDIVAEITVG
jgi:hypothetical protein